MAPNQYRVITSRPSIPASTAAKTTRSSSTDQVRSPITVRESTGRSVNAKPPQAERPRIQVVDHQRHVVVAVAELVGLLTADVDGQLQGVPVTWQTEVGVVGRLEVQPPAQLEAEQSVEGDRRVDVAYAGTGVYESGAHRRCTLT